MIQEATLVVAALFFPFSAPGSGDSTAPAKSLAAPASAEDSGEPARENSQSPRPENIAPVSRSVDVTVTEPSVDWRRLRNGSAMFLGVQHAFRFATEPGTRQGLKGPFFEGWAKSAGALHGWADGDPFLVNYVGHPMQGAVASYIWIAADGRYRGAEFGLNRRYWMSRLRATGYSFFYSAQFEVGAVSEASVGNIQYYYPQQGMVDIVITPLAGLGWTILEDALDKTVIKRIEARTYNPFLRSLARGGLNPARTFGQLMAWRNPLSRDDRPTVYRYDPLTYVSTPRPPEHDPDDVPGVAPLEFASRLETTFFTGARGGGACVGGGATAAFRLSPALQTVVEISGCGLLNPAKGISGDVMSYMVGPRWTPVHRKWRPHLQVLLGGVKVSHDLASNPQVSGEPSQTEDVNAFAFGAGAGLSYKFNRALAMEVATLEYRHALLSPLNGFDYRSSVRFTTGLTLRVGTW